MSTKSKTRTQKKNATTQTSPTDTMLEVAHLQEQVKLLTIENDHLRKCTTEELSSRLTPITPVTRQNDINNTPKYTKSAQRNIQTPSTQEKGNKMSTRCSCKGKCFSKICGCVKKNVLCGPFCKCDIDICKNQENKDTDQNKENLKNIELPSKQIETEQTKNKHLSNAIESKSMFSPDVTQNESEFNIEELRESLYFGSPKQLVFEPNEKEEEEENKKQTKKRKGIKKSTKLDENNQKSVIKQKGRPRKLISEVDVTKHIQENKNILNKEEQDQDDKEIKRGVRKRVPDLEEPPMDEKINETEKRTNNYIQNIGDSTVSLRHGQKSSKRLTNKPNGRYVNNLDSEAIQERSPNSTTNSMAAPHDEINNSSKLFQQKEKKSQNIKTASKNESYNMNESDNNDFNPMEPKHELSRTPIRGLSTSRDENSDTSLAIKHELSRTPIRELSTSRDENSDISLATSVKLGEDRQIPEVFSQPEVDWEEYQSQLVACGKCKRKFHPLRIKKHEFCCKKV